LGYDRIRTDLLFLVWLASVFPIAKQLQQAQEQVDKVQV
jgi:hypothetical protein